MNLITGFLASALAVATIHSVNSEIPRIDESPYSQALLCRGNEMSLELSIKQRNFLSSFDNDNLSISNNGSFFTGSLMARDLFTINEISNFNAVYYHVDFDATYIAGLDVCIIEMTLVKDGTDFMKESVFVFPFETSNNERDAKIVINGCQFYKSDILDERNFLLQNPLISPRDLQDYSGLFLQFEEWLPGLSHNVNDPQPLDDPCGGGVLFPIIGISDAITGIDRVIGFGEQYINIPLISTTSMADWLFFDAKLRKTKENFDHNITAELPISKNRQDTNNTSIRQDNHIFKQSDYTDWNFSFFGNLAAQGCGVIAVYNMLVDCLEGNYIDLPTLIALFETMNADTLFGCFGANMVPSDYVLSLALYLDALAVEVAVQSVATVVSIFSQNVSEAQNEFEAIALGILGVVTTVLTAEAAFAVVDLVFASTAVLTYYFNLYKHDIAFIVGLYVGNRFLHSTMSYYDFSQEVYYGNQNIVCFWNHVLTNGIIVFSEGAHFVYFNRHIINSFFCCYNSRGNDYIRAYEYPYQCIDEISETDASQKIISSYHFYD